jgi:hypothetical protein
MREGGARGGGGGRRGRREHDHREALQRVAEGGEGEVWAVASTNRLLLGGGDRKDGAANGA